MSYGRETLTLHYVMPCCVALESSSVVNVSADIQVNVRQSLKPLRILQGDIP